MVWIWTDLAQDKGLVGGSSEHSNESSDPQKGSLMMSKTAETW
jgi:hypothetical protein